MKKLLSICLALLVVVGLMPVYALAEGGDHTLTVNSGVALTDGAVSVNAETGTATDNGNGTWTISDGAKITITATPGGGKVIDAFSVGMNGVQTVTGNTCVIDGVTADVTVSVSFKPETVTPPPATQYTVSYTADQEGGTISVAKTAGGDVAPGGKVDAGTSITITAAPKNNFELGGIQINSAPLEGTTSYTVNGDINITATFNSTLPAEHTVNFNRNANPTGGMISVTKNGGTAVNSGDTVADGTAITITAAATEGYTLQPDSIQVNGAGISGNTHRVDGDISSITATFTPNAPAQRTVSYNDNPTGGTISVVKTAGGNNVASGSQVDDGTEITITAAATTGYTLQPDSIQVNGAGISGNTYTVTGDVTSITATFTPLPSNDITTRKLTITSPTNGKIEVKEKDGTETYANGASIAVGTELTITATENNGYKLSKLTVDGSDTTGLSKDYTVGDHDFKVSASFVYDGTTPSGPAKVARPIGVYDDDGDLLEDNDGSAFGGSSTGEGRVSLDGVLPNQTFYIALGDSTYGDLVTQLSKGSFAKASQLADDDLFKLSIDKDGDGKSLISSITQVDEKRLGGSGSPRGSYLKVVLKDTTSTDEKKATAEITFKARKTIDNSTGKWAAGEYAVLDLTMWISNTKVDGSDGDVGTGDSVYFSPEANEHNVLIWGDDRAALEFTAADDAEDFYARLSTKSMSDIYTEYGDPVDAELWFYDFVGNPTIPSTSRAYLTLGIPWDDDDDYNPDPERCYIYRVNSDGSLEDVTPSFTYSEDDREIDGWTIRTRTLGTYVVSDTELDIDSYWDDDDDVETPAIDVGNNQKPVPNTGRIG